MVFHHFSNCLLCALSGLKLAQVGLKLVSSCLKLASSWPQVGSRWPHVGSKWCQKSIQKNMKEYILKDTLEFDFCSILASKMVAKRGSKLSLLGP